MAGSQFVEKSQFIAFIKDVIQNRKTGLVSILTESKRSVLLKFSRGVLIHSYSRSRDIGDVIQVINESERIKFDIATIPAEEGTEVLPGKILLQLLQSGNSVEAETQSPATVGNSRSSEIHSARELLESLAAEYVGMVAEVIVEEALDLSGSLEEAIDNIATSIPDPEQSASFRAEARKQTRLISL
ncbi:MAG: hypothetical protein GY806_09195 [Gammaproteobacteria bacterium]|nr:hypothetical protein [Gammaproteobacteria bacterium]